MQLNTTHKLPLPGHTAAGVATAPGFAIYEYLLILQPHEALQQKMMQVKQVFFEKYNAPSAIWGKPHITLVNFLQHRQVEQKLVQRLHTVAMGLCPIKIAFKDYGSFPSHTIYINITSKIPVQHVVKTIRTEAQQLMKLNEDNKPHFILEPHITIARKLLPWQYEQGWLEYSHKHFTASCIADGMLLLKRPLHQRKYEIVQRFAFENLPVSTTQGSLFGASVP
jgi:2'-5' RNA ligase